MNVKLYRKIIADATTPDATTYPAGTEFQIVGGDPADPLNFKVRAPDGAEYTFPRSWFDGAPVSATLTEPLSTPAQVALGLAGVALVLTLAYGLGALFGIDPHVTLLYFAAWDATTARREPTVAGLPTADVVRRWGMYAVNLWAVLAVSQ